MNKFLKLFAVCITVMMVSNIINVRTAAERPAKKQLNLDRSLRNYLHSLEKAGIGDIEYGSLAGTTYSTATINADIAADGLHVHYVKVQIEDSDSQPHYWATTSIAVTVGTNSASGTVVVTTPLVFTGGVGYAKITYKGSWAASEYTTLTVPTMTLFHNALDATTQEDVTTD